MGTEEQHGGLAVVVFPFDPGQCAKPLPCKAFCQQWQEVGNSCSPRELVVGRVQESFDGFDPEHVAELRLQAGGGGLEC